MALKFITLICALVLLTFLASSDAFHIKHVSSRIKRKVVIKVIQDRPLSKENENNNRLKASADNNAANLAPQKNEEWEGFMEGFDWQLEQARRVLEGPGFAPIRMTLWKPTKSFDNLKPPGLWDQFKILFNNALQILGLAESLDGAPMVQIVNKSKGNLWQLISRIADGNLAEIAGGPLFLLLQDYYKQYGPIYKLAFGPKSFIVVSDPVMVKHILKDNPFNYDKGILAEILEPIMGKGLIPADPETWKIRRRAIVPGFHKAWLNAMVSDPIISIIIVDSVVG
jgi:hypothetical protein